MSTDTTEIPADVAADIERLHQLAEITEIDALTISARETITYRRALKQTRAALDEIRDQQLDERLELAQ